MHKTNRKRSARREIHALEYKAAAILAYLDLAFVGKVKGWEVTSSGLRISECKLLERSAAEKKMVQSARKSCSITPGGWKKGESITILCRQERKEWLPYYGAAMHHALLGSDAYFNFSIVWPGLLIDTSEEGPAAQALRSFTDLLLNRNDLRLVLRVQT